MGSPGRMLGDIYWVLCESTQVNPEATLRQWQLIEEFFPPANTTGIRYSDPYLIWKD